METESGIPTIELSDDLELMLNCALRYCLGRRTYIVSAFCHYVAPLLRRLSHNTKYVMKEDLDSFQRDVDTGLYSWGDECDKAEWENFRKKLELNLSEEKSERR